MCCACSIHRCVSLIRTLKLDNLNFLNSVDSFGTSKAISAWCRYARRRHIRRCDNNVYRCQKVSTPAKFAELQKYAPNQNDDRQCGCGEGGDGSPAPGQRFEFHFEIVRKGARRTTQHPVSLFNFIRLGRALFFIFISVVDFRLAASTVWLLRIGCTTSGSKQDRNRHNVDLTFLLI